MPTAELDLEQELSSLPRVRRFVRDQLRDWDAHDLTSRLLLLTTELVSNAVRHAEPPICVRISVDDDRARVAVRDGSPDAPVPKDPTPTDTGGRGLRWVSQFATAWGHTPAPGGGKTVWFEVSR